MKKIAARTARITGASTSKGGRRVKVGALKEIKPGEARVALTPDSAAQLQKLGHECLVQAGAGVAAGFNDATYTRRRA